MFCYEDAKKSLEHEKMYTRQQLISVMREACPDYKNGSYHWQLGEMMKAGDVIRTGYDQYIISDGMPRRIYSPEYSELALSVLARVTERYPYIAFTVFETVLLNEFLNHLVAQNTVFIQVEKDMSSFVFRFLQEEGHVNIMLKPSKKDFDLYWANGTVVIEDLVSEAPLKTADPHLITMEKLLVDIYYDKLIRGTFSRAEYSSIVEQVFDKYQVDRTRMLRYARRRNKEKEISQIFDREKD